MRSLNLTCLDALQASSSSLDAQTSKLGNTYADLRVAITEVEREVTENLDNMAERVSIGQKQLDEQLEEFAEETIPTWFDELQSDLERVAGDAMEECEEVVDTAIEQAFATLEGITGAVRETATEAANELITSGTSHVRQFRDGAERRLVERSEEQARELVEQTLKDLAASNGLDIAASQMSVALSSSIAAALPYLITAKATLGSIRRAMELAR